MAVVNNESLSLTDMSSAAIHQYRATSLLATENWWIGYTNSKSNCNVVISFTPSVALTKVIFKLTASSYTQLGSKPCYYLLNTSSSHPSVGTINGGTSFTFSDKVATITLNQNFTAGTTYYLWISHTNNDMNFSAIIQTSGITCTTTKVQNYTISYNGNAQNSGTVSGLPSSQSATAGTSITVSSTKPTHTNTTATGYKVTFNPSGGTTTKESATSTKTLKYTFSKWNTKADGSGTSYSSGGTYSANVTATLYAQWTVTTTNGSVTLPTAAQCTHPKYELLGFATSGGATSATYAPGASYTPTKAITLYAIWGMKTSHIYLSSTANNFVPYQSYIFSNNSWGLYDAYIYTNGAWVACVGESKVVNVATPDISISPVSLTQYKDLDLEQPGLIYDYDHYLGYINNQGYYWLQFKIVPTVYTTSLRLSFNFSRLITGSVTSDSFPWRLLVADTNAAPTSNSDYTSLITGAPNNKTWYTFNATGLSLNAGSTYYLSVWAGSASYPGGIMTDGSNGESPSYSIVLNTSS